MIHVLFAIALVGAGQPLLRADAGLDGIGRPGRWLPVHVTVDARSEDVDGDLVAEWGRARVRRPVAIPAPSRREFDLYLRTGDVRDVVTVRLERAGRVISQLTLPVRVVGIDDTTTVTLRSPQSPLSWRAYDTADQLVVNVRPPAPAAQDALALWRAIRAAGDAEGTLSPRDPMPAPVTAASFASTTLLAYTAALAVIALLFSTGRSNAFAAYASVLVAALAASTAAFASGRTSPIVVRHQTVAEQFDGASTALVTLKGVAQFPADGDYALRVNTADGVVDPAVFGGADEEELFDLDGRPQLRRHAGLGSTTAFTVESTSAFRAFDVVRRGTKTRVANVSGATLDHCEFPKGFSAPDDRLADGSFVEGSIDEGDHDQIVACRFNGAPIEFSEPHHAVTLRGTTLVVYHFTGVSS